MLLLRCFDFIACFVAVGSSSRSLPENIARFPRSAAGNRQFYILLAITVAANVASGAALVYALVTLRSERVMQRRRTLRIILNLVLAAIPM